MKVLCDYDLRLRPIRLNEDVEVAFSWYQDPKILYFAEGDEAAPYHKETIAKMYRYLDSIGEVYIIEVLQADTWVPIGDATLAKNMTPIVIGDKEFRGKGIGKRVVTLFIQRAKDLGFEKIKVAKVYAYHRISRKLFEAMGFVKVCSAIDSYNREYSTYELVLEEGDEK